MTGAIEAFHIFDEHHHALLSHTYTGRPLSAAHLLPLYTEKPEPRPNLIYLTSTNPATLVFSLTHSGMLFLATSSSEIEPLLVLEYIHRVIDALEEFLEAPLSASKIENNYDVVAQLLTEMCDAGIVSTTEPNALRDLIGVEGFMGKLLGSISLPGKPNFSTNFSNSSAPTLIAQNTPALPWRRANVRHTSNELYADVVETLNVTIAPSGRPLAAFANGTIAFTSKVSGVPDILMTVTGPSGKHNLASIMELPVFHPCVRLAKWKERPGELSFIPPDGRFILAGYEVDLMPISGAEMGSTSPGSLKLPVGLEMTTGLGDFGSDFHIRVWMTDSFRIAGSIPAHQSRGSSGVGRGFGVSQAGTAASPLLEDVVVKVQLPVTVKNLPDIRPTHGDASYNPGTRTLEWQIPTNKLRQGSDTFALRCTAAGYPSEQEEDTEDSLGFSKDYAFDEPYQVSSSPNISPKNEPRDEDKRQQNRILMPNSALVSFTARGWLASGLKIESIQLDPRKSKGLGEGVKPYKGVKYVTISNAGVETRC